MKKIYNTFTEMLKDRDNQLDYRYLLVYSMSSRSLDMTDKLLPQLNWNEVLEFRCFDEYGEIHGFSTADGVCTVEITEEDEKNASGNIQDFVEQEYPLTGALKGDLGDTLMIRRNIRYDEDGQGCIISSRCYGFTQKGGRPYGL